MAVPVSARGTSNANDRGSATSRRARKRWLLATFGDGHYALCAIGLNDLCLGVVDADTIQVDRFPIPGALGGTYDRGNIRPACGPCNSVDGSQLREVLKVTRDSSAQPLARVTTDTLGWHSTTPAMG